MFASDTAPPTPAEPAAPAPSAFEAAEAELVELASHIAAATARLLTQVVAMDRAGMITAPDTMESWLAWRLSIPKRVAKDYVRVAYALEELPRIAAALAAGELSYDKAAAITKIATPATEDTLLCWARSGTAAQVEKIVSSYGQAMAAAHLSEVNERHARRYLDHYFDSCGDFVLRGRLAPEDGAVVASALDAYVDRDNRDDTFGARRADALVEVAQAALGADFEAHPGHLDAYQVMVVVEPEALASDEGRAELFPDVPIHPETARRLACDAPEVTVVTGEPGGRKSRHIPTATRRALAARDRCCSWPGCTNRRFIDAHHIRHRAHGGGHGLFNLTSLCRRHHRMVHEHGYEVRRRSNGELEFVHPSGRVVKASPPIGPPRRELGRLNSATLPATYVDPCDYALAVDLLLPKSMGGFN